jgi:hypothetical protein
MFAVINHLNFKQPVTEETLAAFRVAGKAVVDAGGLAEQVVRVDDQHLILVLMFDNGADAARVARDVGGPFMTEHVVPLLAEDPERSIGEVIVESRRNS